MYKIMTPGPTRVRENVRTARSLETTNPDLDIRFYEEYRRICLLISRLLHTENETYILSGEGILGLEAACASLTEPGDRVLVLDNGIFGRGFADFVRIYGGEPILYTADYERELDVETLAGFLEGDHNFKYATVVHCDTPTGVLNDAARICRLLKKYGILTVVDSVSAMFGEPLSADEGKMDIVCGASQKAVSAPPGLTFVTVSADAKKAMESRRTPVASFYANLLNFRDYFEKKWFPYTMPISDIYGLGRAMDNIAGERDMIRRHYTIATAFRQAVVKAGLSLYLKSGYSSTVTVIRVPEGMKDTDILDTMRERYGVILAGGFDSLAGRVLRVGHMGENANLPDMLETMEALNRTFADLGRPLDCDLCEMFMASRPVF